MPPMAIDAAASRPGDWRPRDADVVRAAATILISNSHLELFYPSTWMAGDGLLGNAFFYFLSGYGVALATSTRSQTFPRWFGRRVARLYPAVVLAGLVIQGLLLGDWRRWTPTHAFETFVFPTPYGYVTHILLVYAGLYWLLRCRSRWPLVVAVAAAVVVTLASGLSLSAHMPPGEPLALGQTGPVLFRAYFTAVALGGALFAPAARRPRGRWWPSLVLLSLLFAVYVGLKFEMVRGHGARAFLLLPLLAAGMCPLAVRVSAADPVQAWLRRVRPLGRAVAVLAAVTLELYVVQTWTHGWTRLERLKFPLNLAGFWAVTIAGAVVLRLVTVRRPFPNAPAPATAAPVLTH